jgi:hypothetical protein
MMRGKSMGQVRYIFQESGINQIGCSKHAQKIEARSSCEATGVAVTWHNTAKLLAIYSYNTADAYLQVWAQCLDHAKDVFGMKNLEKMDAYIVRSFLETKVSQNVSHATFMQYAAALEKLEVTLNMFSEKHERGNTYNFSQQINEIRETAHRVLEKFDGSRAYDNPRVLIDNLKVHDHKIGARIQLESGARIWAVSLIKEKQMQGVENGIGRVYIEAKGGKALTLEMSAGTYNDLAKIIAEKGEFHISQRAYRADIKNAATATSQDYNGSHGFRWNDAQESYAEHIKSGETPDEALKSVSDELGHGRPDITTHYLR